MSNQARRSGAMRSPFTHSTDARWREYSRLKNEWIEAHPNASAREIDAAARAIAAELEL